MDHKSKVDNYKDKLETYHNKVEDYKDVQNAVEELRSVFRFDKIIAFSGGSNLKIDVEDKELKGKIEVYSEQMMQKLIREIMGRLKDYNVAILTGGTVRGVPKIASEIAKEKMLPTIGIYPKRGEKYALGKEYINLEIVIDPIYGQSERGDESSVFAKMADAIIVLGGGAGTLIEFAHAVKINEQLLSNGKDLKKIVPVNGIQGVSEVLFHIPGNDKVKRKTFPQTNLSSGQDIFERLQHEVNLDDNLKEEEFLK